MKRRNLLMLSILAALLFAAGGASAQTDAGGNWRILFPQGSADGLWSGKTRRHSEVVLARIVDLMQVLDGAPGLRFLFVGRRDQTCSSEPSCNPDRLLWERAMAITRRLNSIAPKLRKEAALRHVGSAYTDELALRLDLPPAPDGEGALDLVILADREAGKADPCFGHVMVSEPGLPLVIDAGKETHSLPLPNGVRMQLDPRARIVVRRYGDDDSAVHAFWENDRHQFRCADTGGTGRGEAFAARQPETLHLVFADHPGKALRRFLSHLSKTYESVADAPAFLRHRITADGGRGIGDNVEAFEPGMLHQPTHCSYTFIAAEN